MNIVEEAHKKQALALLVKYDEMLKNLYDYVQKHPRNIPEKDAQTYTDLKNEIPQLRAKLEDFLRGVSPEHHKQLPEQSKRLLKEKTEHDLQSHISLKPS
jgi:hypothetical protein